MSGKARQTVNREISSCRVFLRHCSDQFIAQAEAITLDCIIRAESQRHCVPRRDEKVTGSHGLLVVGKSAAKTVGTRARIDNGRRQGRWPIEQLQLVV